MAGFNGSMAAILDHWRVNIPKLKIHKRYVSHVSG